MTPFNCPIPLSEYPRVLLAHGGGGRLSQHLIEKMLYPSFENRLLEPLHDGAILSLDGARLAFTTDSYVVHPPFFPGGQGEGNLRLAFSRIRDDEILEGTRRLAALIRTATQGT